MRLGFNRNAFTLIELLVIIMILGVMVVAIGSIIAAGSDMSRVRTATRGFMQMSRYARTMAVLHQSAVDLVFSEDGRLGVVLVSGGGGGESIVSARAFATTNAVADAEAARMEEIAAGHGDSDGDGGGKGTYVMAEVNTEKIYEQVRFTFERYTDTADAGRFSRVSPAAPAGDKEEEDEEDGGARAVRVRYKSNGTCRPYRVKVSADGDNAFALTVVVDMLGSVSVEEDER